MAKGLLKKIISEREDLASRKIRVISAGTGGFSGRGTTRETIEIMSREGVDVSGHIAQSLSDEIIEKADLILVMESFHKDAIVRRVSQAKSKVYLITELKKSQGLNEGEATVLVTQILGNRPVVTKRQITVEGEKGAKRRKTTTTTD